VVPPRHKARQDKPPNPANDQQCSRTIFSYDQDYPDAAEYRSKKLLRFD
jgi:hypothetical protein